MKPLTTFCACNLVLSSPSKKPNVNNQPTNNNKQSHQPAVDKQNNPLGFTKKDMGENKNNALWIIVPFLCLY